VQTVCEFCKSILVRTDVDLKKSRPRSPISPPDSSHPFSSVPKASTATNRSLLVGRILYEYDQGGWNEWHVMMNDGNKRMALRRAKVNTRLSLSSKAQNLPAVAQVPRWPAIHLE